MKARTLVGRSMCASVLITMLSAPGGQLFGSAGIGRGVAPELTIWAWERDRDLSFAERGASAIAYCAGTIVIRNERAFWKPRLQKLALPRGMRATPVFRIENLSEPNQDQSISKSLDNVIAPIVEVVDREGCQKIQIDFDAKESERKFYVQLIDALKKRLPARCAISITALASWCLHDAWLDDVKADEAVVMLFSMGSSGNQTLRVLEHERLRAGNLPLSIGISANERKTNRKLKELGLLNRSKIYVFNSLPWTESRLQVLQKEICE